MSSSTETRFGPGWREMFGMRWSGKVSQPSAKAQPLERLTPRALGALVALDNQSQVFLVGGGAGGGVPEPATWVMMIIGFGAVGAAARSSRRKRNVVTA